MTIKKIQKTFSALLSLVIMLSFSLVVPMSTYAAVSDGKVVNSGDDVEIELSTENKTEVEVENENYAVINQEVCVTENSGGNSVDGNIGDDITLRTGNNVAAFSLDASANENKTVISGGGSQVATLLHGLDVVNTGNDLEVESEMENEQEVKVKNNNEAYVNQSFHANLNSGDNDSEDNIGDDILLQTGNNAVSGEFDVNVNKNHTLVGLGSGTPVLASETVVTNTGDDAEVEVETENETKVHVYNWNSAWINQYMSASLNSGDNDVKDNIGDDIDLHTGNNQAVVGMDANANANHTGIGAMFGTPLLLNQFDVVNTGNDLEAESEMENETDVKVKNHNWLLHNQWIAQYSTSGDNEFEDNVGGAGHVSGGNAAGGSLEAHGNSSTTVLGDSTGLLALILGIW